MFVKGVRRGAPNTQAHELSGWATGSGRSSRALTAVKISVFDPMPRASSNTTTLANRRARHSDRIACRISRATMLT
jgi:hypothetical protein